VVVKNQRLPNINISNFSAPSSFEPSVFEALDVNGVSGTTNKCSQADLQPGSQSSPRLDKLQILIDAETPGLDNIDTAIEIATDVVEPFNGSRAHVVTGSL
jgi:hypothetical protein